ncbi:hypothetical protein vseg_017872 [Gypsophila vaccaria]
MVNTNKRNRQEPVTCSRYLPPELWTHNIIPRLPVKKVFQCRTVCRTWCAGIDTPAFVAAHSKLSDKNTDKNPVLAIEKLGLYGHEGCRLTVRRRNSLRKCANIVKTYGTYYLSVRCKGLLFVQDDSTRTLKVWNPSIRKSLTLPQCPLVPAGYGNIKYLFGFRPLIDDYVVYAFRADHAENDLMSTSVAVYTLSDNRWRIRDDKMSLPNWLFERARKIMCDDKSVYVDGEVHWLRYDLYECNRLVRPCLVSFNFNAELFSFTDVPGSRPISPCAIFRFLFVAGDTLAVFALSYINSSVWVLKNNVWDLWYLGHSSPDAYRYICDHPNETATFLYLSDRVDNVRFIIGKISYNIMTNEAIRVLKTLTSRLILDTYVENMVLHRGCDGQILTPI